MDHTKELIELAHRGNREARDLLVMENMGLVYSVAKRFYNRGHEIEDLCQIGTIGLIKAIDKFDLEQPVMFSTYAVPMISGEIKRFIRDDGMIKISRSIKENNWKIKQAERSLMQKLGREATIEELAAETGIFKEDIVMAMEAAKEVESIYQTVYQKDGNSMYVVDKLAAYTEIPASETVVNKLLLEQMLHNLPDLERQIIELRYYEDKTQVQVAAILGISQVQVSRMEKKILVRMREEAKSE